MRHLVLLFLTFGFISMHAQSPWVKKKGGGFVQFSYTTIPEYNTLFLENGSDFNTSRSLTDQTYQIYGEYGLTEKLTLRAVLPFKVGKAKAAFHESSVPVTGITIIDSGSQTGWSNISIAARYKLPSKKFNSAFQLKVDLPVTKYDKNTGLSTGYNATTILPMFSLGKGFSKNNYAFVYAGYGIRTNQFSDLINTGFEAGHRFFNQLWVILFVDANLSMYNGTPTTELHPLEQLQTGFYVNDQEYVAWGIKIIEKLTKRFGVTAGFGGAFSGNLVAKSPALSIGSYYKW